MRKFKTIIANSNATKLILNKDLVDKEKLKYFNSLISKNLSLMTKNLSFSIGL